MNIPLRLSNVLLKLRPRYAVFGVCAQITSWIPYRTCGDDGARHWIFEEMGPEGHHTSSTCKRHGPIDGEPYTIIQGHEIGDACGMPGAAWNLETNRCEIDDDELDEMAASFERAMNQPSARQWAEQLSVYFDRRRESGTQPSSASIHG